MVGYVIDVPCGAKDLSGLYVYIEYSVTTREAPWPETLTYGVLGPNFPTYNVDIYENYITVNGVDVGIPRYGIISDIDEASKWVEGSPDGDWLGYDYYKANVISIQTTRPEDWAYDPDFPFANIGPSSISDNGGTFWQTAYVDQNEFQALVDGAEIRFTYTCPNGGRGSDTTDTGGGSSSPDNPGVEPNFEYQGVNLYNASTDFLDRITEQDIILDYYDQVLVDKPTLIDTGWQWVMDTVESFKIASPAFAINDEEGGSPLLFEEQWVSIESEVPVSGNGLVELTGKVAEGATSAILDILEQRISQFGPGFSNLFESVGEAKDIHDRLTTIQQKVFLLLDGYVYSESNGFSKPMGPRDVERIWGEIADEIDELVASKLPLYDVIKPAISFFSQHSDYSYGVVLDDIVSLDESNHSTRIAFGEGNFQYSALDKDDWLIGNLGENLFDGGEGDDWLSGGGDNDTLIGGLGNDHMYGGSGDDSLFGGLGNDTIDGGAGFDQAHFEGSQNSYSLHLSADGAVLINRSVQNEADSLLEIELLGFDDLSYDFAIDLSRFGGAASIEDPDLFEAFIELYIAYFNRAPDAVGLNFWGTAFATGTTLEEMATLFVDQDETRATYPEGTSNLDFATSVYSNVLGRIPDQLGLDFWVGVLDQGGVTRDQFILEVLRGAKADLRPDLGQDFVDQQLADKAYLAAKIDVGAYFAVQKGMSDVENAQAVMELFDGSDASIEAAIAAADEFYQAALDPTGGEFIMKVVGVLDDPFTM